MTLWPMANAPAIRAGKGDAHPFDSPRPEVHHQAVLPTIATTTVTHQQSSTQRQQRSNTMAKYFGSNGL